MALGPGHCRCTAARLLCSTVCEAADLSGLKELGNIYGRLTHPTDSMPEERLTIPEGGAGAVSAAFGTATIF